MAIHAGDTLTHHRPRTDDLVVQARGISRAFDGRGVLHDIDLDIAPDEFIALLGRSGSGKSTLLRILARLDGDYEGRFEGPTLPSVAFQDSRLLPWKSVLDNVALGLRGDAQRAHALDLLAEVGLRDHARAWPKTLSGGEAQRAALARSLVRNPQLLLMDEPFGALDALTRIRMHRLLKNLREHYRPAVLLVTHDIDEAILLADRVIVLTDGRIAHDLPVDLDPEGRRRDSRFGQLRAHLLDALGVEGDDH